MDDQELQEFSLEDIMREFGSHQIDPPKEEESQVAQAQYDTDDDAQVVEAEYDTEEAEVIEAEYDTEEDSIEAEEDPTGESVDELQPEGFSEEPETEKEEAFPEEVLFPEEGASHEAPAEKHDVTGDTIRMEAIVLPKGQVRNAQPAEDALEELPVQDTQEEVPDQEPQEQDAFTEKWEPEYEQPMGEYVPPQPIIFQPRSRLLELKRKLVAGPEKKYYELTEMGLGKLQIAIFLNFLLVVLAGISTGMYAAGMVQPNRMRLLVFFQVFAMLLSALLGSFQLIDGLTAPFRKRFTLNTLLVITFGVCCADAILCLKQLRVPCCAAFTLEMTLSLCNTYQQRVAQTGQMDTLRKATRLNGLCAQPDYYENAKGFLRKEGQVEDFMEQYDQRSAPQKILDFYALTALIVCVGIGVTAGCFTGSISAALQVSAVSLLAAVPATAFITLSRPLAVLERRLHRLGTVICGWQGVTGLRGKAVFPLGYSDLFPGGSVKMNGVKFFGNRDPDEIVAYSTALVVADGGGLAPLFTQVLDSRNGHHYDTQEFRVYEEGIGGVVCGEPVLAGDAAFLRDMGVEVPDSVRVSNAVYVAIDGELCGLFAMTYDKVKSTMAGLSTLCAHKGLNPLLTATDFTLNENALYTRLGLRTKKFLIPQREVRSNLSQVEPEEENPALLLTTKEGLAPLAYGVTGARALYTTSILGLIIHLVGGILGMCIMLALVLMGGLHLLTPANLFLYQLIWMIPGLLITEWTRAI